MRFQVLCEEIIQIASTYAATAISGIMMEDGNKILSIQDKLKSLIQAVMRVILPDLIKTQRFGLLSLYFLLPNKMTTMF